MPTTLSSDPVFPSKMVAKRMGDLLPEKMGLGPTLQDGNSLYQAMAILLNDVLQPDRLTINAYEVRQACGKFLELNVQYDFSNNKILKIKDQRKRKKFHFS